MMRGQVNANGEPLVRLRVRGPADAVQDVDAAVDTGFTSALALPNPIVVALGLAVHSAGTAGLADGSVHQFDVYAGEIEWDGAWKPVLVYALGDQGLLGMQLLAGHELRIEVVPGGAVEIKPLR